MKTSAQVIVYRDGRVQLDKEVEGKGRAGEYASALDCPAWAVAPNGKVVYRNKVALKIGVRNAAQAYNAGAPAQQRPPELCNPQELASVARMNSDIRTAVMQIDSMLDRGTPNKNAVRRLFLHLSQNPAETADRLKYLNASHL